MRLDKCWLRIHDDYSFLGVGGSPDEVIVAWPKIAAKAVTAPGSIAIPGECPGHAGTLDHRARRAQAVTMAANRSTAPGVHGRVGRVGHGGGLPVQTG